MSITNKKIRKKGFAVIYSISFIIPSQRNIVINTEPKPNQTLAPPPIPNEPNIVRTAAIDISEEKTTDNRIKGVCIR